MRSSHLLLLLLLTTLTACQSTSTTSTNHTSDNQTLILPTLDPSDPARFALPSLTAQTYRFTSGPRQDQIDTAKTQPYPHPPFAYKTTTPDKRIEYGAFNEQGAPILLMTEDLHHKAATFYTPPIPLIPNNIQPGQTQTFNTQITVLQLHAPWFVRDSGAATVTITNDGPTPPTPNTNNLPTQRFTTTWKIKLTFASVAVTSTAWYHPDHGLVALKHDETITALFFPIKSNWAMQLQNESPSQ